MATLNTDLPDDPAVRFLRVHNPWTASQSPLQPRTDGVFVTLAGGGGVALRTPRCGVVASDSAWTWDQANEYEQTAQDSVNARILRGGERDYAFLKFSGPRPERHGQPASLALAYPVFSNE